MACVPGAPFWPDCVSAWIDASEFWDPHHAAEHFPAPKAVRTPPPPVCAGHLPRPRRAGSQGQGSPEQQGRAVLPPGVRAVGARGGAVRRARHVGGAPGQADGGAGQAAVRAVQAGGRRRRVSGGGACGTGCVRLSGCVVRLSRWENLAPVCAMQRADGVQAAGTKSSVDVLLSGAAIKSHL